MLTFVRKTYIKIGNKIIQNFNIFYRNFTKMKNKNKKTNSKAHA